ncbi:MAG: nucleoside triphosphate pyrophosphohydrolase [Acidobacteria bacterium]|nr:nucleoside triphosphate pyrophosphohydrolase [Acidobacteriota bacterium]
MDRLRDENGCPWDREQTLDNMKTYILEEVYEVLETIDAREHEKLREEMGDLLFQIVFICRLMKEESKFDIEGVIDGIATKMRRRHPHVFGESDAKTSADVLEQWEAIKAKEKDSDSIFHDLEKAGPALLTSHHIGSKASRVGFDWPSAQSVLEKLKEEIAELEAELSRPDGRVAEEVGDLLFATSNLARLAGVDPEDALRRANLKFVRRFKWIEDRLRDIGEKPRREIVDQMEELWGQAKKELGPG